MITFFVFVFFVVIFFARKGEEVSFIHNYINPYRDMPVVDVWTYEQG